MQTLHSSPKLLGIDWGTSNRRAYLIDPSGRCLASHADDQGMLAVRPNFEASLAALRAAMGVSGDVPIIASGMVGSAQGWREVPYLDTKVPLEDLPRHLMRPGPRHAIVPGYCQRQPAVDVMRGEETQLLGMVALGQRDGWVVLPGTHSKWVLLRDGAIQRLSTFMTGELFAMLSAQGTLAPMMSGPDSDEAFAAGIAEARKAAPLSNALFGVRARVVSGAMPAGAARSFLSGLLIGTEFHAALALLDGASPTAAPLACIASPALQQRYADAAAPFGITLNLPDPDQVYCAALARFFE
jgi:2-dehydro-3-deoxygalactonokinase